MRWEEIDDPACGPGDVVIDVHACGLNHSDLDSRAGTSRWPFTMPWVLGAEFAGTVSQVGDEVVGIAVGDPVTAFQQYACGRCAACAQLARRSLRAVRRARYRSLRRVCRAGVGAGPCGDPAAELRRVRARCRSAVQRQHRVVDGHRGRGRATGGDRARPVGVRRRRERGGAGGPRCGRSRDRLGRSAREDRGRAGARGRRGVLLPGDPGGRGGARRDRRTRRRRGDRQHRRAAVRRPRGCDGARRQARDVRRACGRGGAARPRRSCSGEATGCSGSGSRAPTRSVPP